MKIFQPAILFLCFASQPCAGQKVNGKIMFEPGQTLEVVQQVKSTITQQAMGQVIDFNMEATGLHTYQVTNITGADITLKHQLNQVLFSVDGMGQKINFDSKQEKDINGEFGKPIKELLEKRYEMIIDNYGNTLMAVPEYFPPVETESNMAFIAGLLKDISILAHPPQKGKPGFFRVLPEKETVTGYTWTEASESNPGELAASYTITEINDSVIVVGFNTRSVTVTRAEMMGSETTTTTNNQSTGKIILDRATGIVREKLFKTTSAGNMEAPFGSVPVATKTSTIITVKPVH